MRKILLVTASLAGLGLLLPAAQAADVVPPAPAFSWTGFHIGAGGGGGWNTYDANATWCDNGAQPANCDGSFEDEDLDVLLKLDDNDLGAFYGFGTVEAGFDYDFGGFVLGILGSYDFNGNNDAESDADVFDQSEGHSGHIGLKAELDDSWFLGGRLGATVGGLTGGDNTSLIYVLGGYTWVDGKVEADGSNDCLQVCIFGSGHADEKDNVDGWTVGGGIETMLWEALSLKVEYRHDFLDDIKFDECGDGNDCNEHLDGKVNFDRDTVRAVLSWRFDPFSW